MQHSKFRNNATNIGIYCGFACAEGYGQIRVLQTACREMGMLFDLDDGARLPTQDFEPVTVIYRAEPGRPGEKPTFTALHVTRLARTHVPKGFWWKNGAWTNDVDFYPFTPEKAGPLRLDLDAMIAEQHDWPAWLLAAAENDAELSDLLAQGGSRSRLSNRLLVSGRVVTAGIEPVYEGSEYSRLNLLLRQPGDVNAFAVRYGERRPAFAALANRRYPPGGMAVTAVLKPETTILDHDGVNVLASEFSIQMIEMLTLVDTDIAPGASLREVMAG